MKNYNCIHNWVGVYFGGFEVECSNCGIGIYDVKNDKECDFIINKLCNISNNKKP